MRSRTLLFLRDWFNKFQADGRKPGLVIALTSGTDPLDHDLPDEAAKLRMDRMAAELRLNPGAKGMIVGDYRDAHGRTLAQKYHRWFRMYYPTVADRVTWGGEGNNTVWDLRSLSLGSKCRNRGYNYWTVALCTDWDHMVRSAPSLYAEGLRVIWLASGEKQRPKLREVLGLIISLVDPRWSWFPGKMAARLAQKDADAYREKTSRPATGGA